MGQLRALRSIQTANGDDLISQARVLSTVSGGSWLGVTFEYLTPGTSDDDYLNRLVADPGRFVPSQAAGHSVAETLDQLPAGNIGQAIASRDFGPVLLAIQVLLLHRFAKVPTPFLWQTAIAIHVLKRYGLFEHDRHLVPSSYFSFDAGDRRARRGGPQSGPRRHDRAPRRPPAPAAAGGLSCSATWRCSCARRAPASTCWRRSRPTPFATGIFGMPAGRRFRRRDGGRRRGQLVRLQLRPVGWSTPAR